MHTNPIKESKQEPYSHQPVPGTSIPLFCLSASGFSTRYYRPDLIGEGSGSGLRSSTQAQPQGRGVGLGQGQPHPSMAGNIDLLIAKFIAAVRRRIRTSVGQSLALPVFPAHALTPQPRLRPAP
jgi:hypothetical protein